MGLSTLALPLSHALVNAGTPALVGSLDSARRARIGAKLFYSAPPPNTVNASRRTGWHRTFSQAQPSSGEPENITEGVDEDEIINVGVSDVEEPVEIPNPVTDFSAPPPPPEAPIDDPFSEAQGLKEALFDNLYGTYRGFSASSETRGEIAEIVTQLEALNPTPATTDALSLLEGKWLLAYTSFSELFPLLAAGSLPLINVEEISQSIDTTSSSVTNAVTFSGPLGSSTFTTKASYEVRSSKRLQVKFEEGVLEPPQITSSIQLPGSVEVAGQKIELSSLQGVIRPLEEAASAIARLISGQPPLKFPFPSPQAQSWLLTTFLDEDLRISRGDGGSLFVLVKEGSTFKP